MKFKSVHFIGLMVVLLSGAAYFFMPDGASPGPGAPKQRQAIRLGLSAHIASATVMVALDKGFLSDEGLDASVRAYPTGVRALNEGLFTGLVDVANATEFAFAMASLERKPVTIIAMTNTAVNANRIVARRDAGIATAGDLRGKRVATQKASAVHFFLHRFLLRHSMSEKDIKLSFLPAEQLPSALLNGEIDAFSMREPYISQARNLLGDKVVVFDAPGVYEQTDALALNNAYLNAHPSVVRPLLRALIKAENFIESHPGQAIAIVARRMAISEAEVASIWPSMEFAVGFQQSNLLLMENQLRWAIAEGLSANTAMPNMLDSIRIDALKELKPQATSLIQ